MKRTAIYLLGFLMLLASCSVMQRFGIEKRRYRPGFFVNTVNKESAQKEHPISIASKASVLEKKIASFTEPGRDSEISISESNGTVATKIKLPNRKNLIEINVGNVQVKQVSNVNTAESIQSKGPDFTPHLENTKQLIGYLIFIFLWIGGTILFYVLIPGISVEAAEGLALLSVLVLIFLLWLAFHKYT